MFINFNSHFILSSQLFQRTEVTARPSLKDFVVNYIFAPPIQEPGQKTGFLMALHLDQEKAADSYQLNWKMLNGPKTSLDISSAEGSVRFEPYKYSGASWALMGFVFSIRSRTGFPVSQAQEIILPVLKGSARRIELHSKTESTSMPIRLKYLREALGKSLL
jgi:hypothetical protein